MQNEIPESKNVPADTIQDGFASTLAKLVEDNANLKKRVKTLEDKCESLKEDLDSVIQIFSNELRGENIKSEDPHRPKDDMKNKSSGDNEQLQYNTSEFQDQFKHSGRSKFSDDKIINTYKNRENRENLKHDSDRSSHKYRRSPNRSRTYDDDRRSKLHTDRVKLQSEKVQKNIICDKKNVSDSEHIAHRYRSPTEYSFRRSHNTERSSHGRRSSSSSQRRSIDRRIEHQDEKYSREHDRATVRSNLENHSNIVCKKRKSTLHGDSKSYDDCLKESNDTYQYSRRSYEIRGDNQIDSNEIKDSTHISRRNAASSSTEHEGQRQVKLPLGQRFNSAERPNYRNQNNETTKRNQFIEHETLQCKEAFTKQNGSISEFRNDISEIDKVNRRDPKEVSCKQKVDNRSPQVSGCSNDTEKCVNNIDKRERVQNLKETKKLKVDIPPNFKELWCNTDGMRPIIQSVEDLKKIQSTPIKLINNLSIFSTCKLVSPIANTPDQLKEKFKELEKVKISPVPFLNENRVADINKEENQLKKKVESNVQISAVSLVNENVVAEENEKPSQTKGCVEIKTIVGADDVEHRVFKRKRRV